MKKIIIVSLLFIAASCSIIAVRHVACRVPAKPMQSDPPVLKEWVNDSMADLPPGDGLRYHPEWVGDAERTQLESVWAAAATNLLNGNVRGMKECVATVSERMKGISDGQFFGIVRPCYELLKGEFMGGILLRSYATPEEFRACVMVDIEGMNVLGDVELSAVLVPDNSAI